MQAVRADFGYFPARSLVRDSYSEVAKFASADHRVPPPQNLIVAPNVKRRSTPFRGSERSASIPS
jgi:hypothetical protein